MEDQPSKKVLVVVGEIPDIIICGVHDKQQSSSPPIPHPLYNVISPLNYTGPLGKKVLQPNTYVATIVIMIFIQSYDIIMLLGSQLNPFIYILLGGPW